MTAMDTQKLGTVEGDIIVSRLSAPGVKYNLGGVKTLNIGADTDAERVEVQVHNRADITGSSPTGIVNVQFLENVDPEKISLFTGATLTSVAGAPVSVTGEALGTGWTVGQPIKLANRMGDKTIVTSIVIDADASALIAGTDYETYVADGTNGEIGYTYIVPKTVQAGVLDADYDYTPNASTTATLTRKYRNDDLLKVEIVTVANEAGEVNTYTLESCTAKGQYLIELVNLAIAGDLEGTTLEFELSRGADMTWNIETL